jgi:hypothetical protein
MCTVADQENAIDARLQEVIDTYFLFPLFVVLFGSNIIRLTPNAIAPTPSPNKNKKIQNAINQLSAFVRKHTYRSNKNKPDKIRKTVPIKSNRNFIANHYQS